MTLCFESSETRVEEPRTDFTLVVRWDRSDTGFIGETKNGTIAEWTASAGGGAGGERHMQMLPKEFMHIDPDVYMHESLLVEVSSSHDHSAADTFCTLLSHASNRTEGHAFILYGANECIVSDGCDPSKDCRVLQRSAVNHRWEVKRYMECRVSNARMGDALATYLQETCHYPLSLSGELLRVSENEYWCVGTCRENPSKQEIFSFIRDGMWTRLTNLQLERSKLLLLSENHVGVCTFVGNDGYALKTVLLMQTGQLIV